jgi:RimJ/RimL family protein N-acetyltransferase
MQARPTISHTLRINIAALPRTTSIFRSTFPTAVSRTMAANSPSVFDPEGPLVSSTTLVNPGDIPALTLPGKHVTLAPLHLSHAPALYANVGGLENGQLFTYLSTGPYTDLASFETLIEKLSDNPISLCAFAILSTDPVHASNRSQGAGPNQAFEETGQVKITSLTAVGIICFLNINPTHHTIEIGHVLYAPTLQRTTAATEAVYLLMKWAFEQGYQRVEWKCNDRNEPSKRAALRLGYVFEGVFRKHMVVKRRRRDTAWYSVVDEGWEEGHVREALEMWMDERNFDESGKQKKKLEEIREGLGKKS